MFSLSLGSYWYGSRQGSTPAPAAPAPVTPAPGTPATGGTPPAPAPGTGANPTPAPGTPAAGGGATACTPGQAGEYFPYKVGTQATYAGQGNEFASYTVKVLHQSGNKVEWRRDTGGTVMAEVFQVTPAQVERIYREGEAYDNTPRLNAAPNVSEVILKGPVQVGTQWTVGNTTHKITSTNATVQALNNQSLSCVVVVESQSPTSLIRTYFHKQYGIVLSVFDPAGSPIESRLSAFTP